MEPIDTQRFWSKVAKGESCWLWTSAKKPSGYGNFGSRWRTYLAHRVSYELAVGSIPTGLQVLHSCDTPSCVNPAHLRIGTQADNMRDAIARHRRPPSHVDGAKNPNAKLSEADVRAIRADTRSHAATGRAYGLHPDHVSRIRRGLSWKADVGVAA